MGIHYRGVQWEGGCNGLGYYYATKPLYIVAWTSIIVLFIVALTTKPRLGKAARRSPASSSSPGPPGHRGYYNNSYYDNSYCFNNSYYNNSYCNSSYTNNSYYNNNYWLAPACGVFVDRGARGAEQGLREMGGAPRNPAPRNHLLGVDCQITRLPLHRCIWWRTNIVECRPPLGALSILY